MSSTSLKVAWLLPVAWYYWQPALSLLTQLLPETRILTALWPGYTQGFEDTLNIQVVGRWKVLRPHEEGQGYGPSFTYVPLSVVGPLLRFRPQVVFTNAFGLWTLLAVTLKPLFRWRVVIAYEGSSPGVDFRHSPLRLILRRAMVALADAVISNSQAGRAYLVEVLKAPADRAFAHPYEVPAPESLAGSIPEPVKTPIPAIEAAAPVEKPLTFLFVGRLRPRKGLRMLLEATARLKQAGSDRVVIRVVGDGEEQAALQALSQELGLEDWVEWLGRVPYEVLSQHFKAADVFVLPTYEDTWGVVISEAMLLGKAILCSSAAGAAELVVHGTNGYVFDPHRPEELATWMETFVTAPEQAAIMGQHSQQIMERYTPAAAAQFYLRVIHRVLTPTLAASLPTPEAEPISAPDGPCSIKEV